MERVSRIAGGSVGATAIHVETGRIANLKANEPFPMASAFKIPLAVKLLAMVDEGCDLHPGTRDRDVLELMLLISGNSATDVLLGRRGRAEGDDGEDGGFGVGGHPGGPADGGLDLRLLGRREAAT